MRQLFIVTGPGSPRRPDARPAAWLAVLGDEDVGLEGEGIHVSAVQSHCLVRRRLSGFQTTDPQEALADVGEGFRIVLETSCRLPDFKEAEGLHEGDTVILSDMSRWDKTDRIRLE